VNGLISEDAGSVEFFIADGTDRVQPGSPSGQRFSVADVGHRRLSSGRYAAARRSLLNNNYV